MNLILLSPQEVNGNTAILSDRRAKHIRKILKCKAGDQVRVGILNGEIGTAVIEEVSLQSILLRISVSEAPPQKIQTDLILAAPRPIMLKRVLAQAASLGVNRIFLINANRVEKSFFNASIMKEQAFDEPLRLGLEQAVDTVIPLITLHPRFRPFIEDELPGLIAACPVRLLAHPDTAKTLPEVCPPPLKGHTVLAIGPEGGWVDFEVEKFREQGFATFSLGPRILRVDTAVPALLSQIALLRRLA